MRRAFDLDVLACPRCGAHWPGSRWGSRCCTCSSGVKDQVPREVYEAQVALMEMSLDREVVLGGLKEARKAGVSPSV